MKELTEAAAKEKELKARVKGLAEQLESVTAAHSLATSEIQVGSRCAARNSAGCLTLP